MIDMGNFPSTQFTERMALLDSQPPAQTLSALLQLPIRLKALRESRGLTVAEVARACGIGYSTVWRLERAEIASPTLENVLHLAEFFQVPLSELLAFNPTPPSPPAATPEVGELLTALQGIIDQLAERNITAVLTVTVRGTEGERR